MTRPVDEKYRISQTFGNDLVINGVHIYAQWGYKGHNGIDYACPTGTEGKAPHKGKIYNGTDPGGYGMYTKIVDTDQESILGHLNSYKFPDGYECKEGEVVVITNNTGNSTGSHLHWGWRPIPYNKNNGYGGYEDPTNLIGKGDDMALQSVLDHFKVKNEVELVTVIDKQLRYLEEERAKNKENQLIIDAKIKDVENITHKYELLKIASDEISEQISTLKAELAKCGEEKEKTPAQLAVLEPARYVAFYIATTLVTNIYNVFPLLGTIEPDMQVYIALVASLILRGIDKYIHKSDNKLRGLLPF